MKLSMLIDADESRSSIPPSPQDTERKPGKKRGRKKKLQGPPYICDYPNCYKKFHRSEHLARHQLNHNPKTIYRCPQPYCEKTFVRHDLLVRHMKRHAKKKEMADEKERERLVLEQPEPVEASQIHRLQVLQIQQQRQQKQQGLDGHSQPEPLQESQSSAQTHPDKLSATQIIQQHSQALEGDNQPTPAPNLLSWLFNDNVAGIASGVASNGSSNGTDNGNYTGLADHPIESADSNDFLTGLNEFQMNNGGQGFFISDGFDQLTQGLEFMDSGNGNGFHNEEPDPMDNVALCRLTDANLAEFASLIPEIKLQPDFTQIKLEKALRMYWKFWHPRFPMLHRPSFNASEMPPLLLLAMFVLGIKLAQCVDDVTVPAEERFTQPKVLADKIALPLRWLIFASPEFQPPAKLWIIQALLMLEFYEKNCTTRQLHERAHLHHGTTIQLLRRSPTLGGSTHKVSSNDESDNWLKWIEIESMKRATFTCFYMDAIDAISFGHQMLIYAHQIQMTMPVEDDLWEAGLHNFHSVFKRCKRPQPFLLVLKNILNGLPTRTNSFGKKVLLAGLSAIMFQIQQRDLQLMFGLDKFGMTGTVNNWRELLTAAFSIWRNDVGGSCCSSRTAIDNMSSMKNSLQFSTSDTRCKCITYHMAHVYMSISHYDLFIVGGAPWRMNVKPSSDYEREQIEKRVAEWSRTRHSEVCVVQCYLLLFETFLSPQDSSYEYQYDYLPDQDLFFRSYVIGLCTLVLWVYIYSRYGEDVFAQTAEAERTGEPEEDGYRYLKRMRNEFTRRSGGIMLHTWFSNPSGADFYANMAQWLNVLDEIPDKQKISGLLQLVGTKMVNADYTVVKEVGKLLIFCRKRCLGEKKKILDDMYE